MLKHRTKDGRIMLISEMSDSHLLATIRLIERKANTGVVVRNGGGSCPDDFWYEKETVYGKCAKDVLNYSQYTKEASKRRLIY